VENISSENSFKGSHSSLTSSCQSDACLPSYQQVVTSAQIHVSDSDSEKQRPTTAGSRRKKSQTEDPGGGLGQLKLDISKSTNCHKETSLPQRPLPTNGDSEASPVDVNKDVSVTIYQLTSTDTSCVTDGVNCSSTET